MEDVGSAYLPVPDEGDTVDLAAHIQGLATKLDANLKTLPQASGDLPEVTPEMWQGDTLRWDYNASGGPDYDLVLDQYWALDPGWAPWCLLGEGAPIDWKGPGGTISLAQATPNYALVPGLTGPLLPSTGWWDIEAGCEVEIASGQSISLALSGPLAGAPGANIVGVAAMTIANSGQYKIWRRIRRNCNNRTARLEFWQQGGVGARPARDFFIRATPAEVGGPYG